MRLAAPNAGSEQSARPNFCTHLQGSAGSLEALKLGKDIWNCRNVREVVAPMGVGELEGHTYFGENLGKEDKDTYVAVGDADSVADRFNHVLRWCLGTGHLVHVDGGFIASHGGERIVRVLVDDAVRGRDVVEASLPGDRSVGGDIGNDGVTSDRGGVGGRHVDWWWRQPAPVVVSTVGWKVKGLKGFCNQS